MKKVTRFGLEVLTGKALSFWLEFIDKTGGKVFCLQTQIKLKPCGTLFSSLDYQPLFGKMSRTRETAEIEPIYLVDLFINKLKTKFNNLFHRMILNTKRRNVPARAKETPSKVLFVAKKKRRPPPFGKYPLLATSTSVNNCYLLTVI